MPKQPKNHVKKHLDDRQIDPATLPDPVIDALNAFTPEELSKVDNLGDALMSAGAAVPSKMSVVH
jgi:hypothetical protein